MKCPVCRDPDLVMADRQGIEIDYCPQCRGVWLDRGELDKIIERSAGLGTRPSVEPDRMPGADPFREYPEQRHHPHDDYQGSYRRKKHKGFLGELFDFD